MPPTSPDRSRGVTRGAVYRLGPAVPRIHPSVFIGPGAIVAGDVEIAEDASVWPGTVLRADYGRIVIGARTNIQDGSVVHATASLSTVLGADVVVGHGARLEGCVIEDAVLIGMGAVVLHGARIETGALVAAGAVVTPRTVVGAGSRAAGVPATIRPPGPGGVDEQVVRHRAIAAHYVENARRWVRELAPVVEGRLRWW